MKIQDAEIEEAKQTKARNGIEEVMKAVTVLIKAVEFEMGNTHSRASIHSSERKRGMDCPSSTKNLQYNNELTPANSKTIDPNNVNPKKMKFGIAQKKLIFLMPNTP